LLGQLSWLALAPQQSFTLCTAAAAAAAAATYPSLPHSPGSILAFKALLAADTTGSSIKRAARNVTGHALGSGSYSIWWDVGNGIGATTSEVSTAHNVQDCLKQCDKKSMCAAAAMLVGTVNNLTTLDVSITKCTLIMGDSTHATYKRSVTRVDISHLVTLEAKPDGELGTCPKIIMLTVCPKSIMVTKLWL
jgi:hypothetical protein